MAEAISNKPAKGGERAINAARIKINVLSSTLRLLGKRSFRDLHVDEICKDSGISKVTLFKYFPQKEDILLYYMRVWAFNRSMELHQKPRHGLKGVYYLFDRLADTYEKHPGLALGMVSYLTSDNRPPQPIPLKSMERRVLYPGKRFADELQVLTIPQFLENFLLEAILDREIDQASDARDLAQLFSSLLYGTLVTAHLKQLSPMRMVFRKHIDMTLKGLQGKRVKF